MKDDFIFPPTIPRPPSTEATTALRRGMSTLPHDLQQKQARRRARVAGPCWRGQRPKDGDEGHKILRHSFCLRTSNDAAPCFPLWLPGQRVESFRGGLGGKSWNTAIPDGRSGSNRLLNHKEMRWTMVKRCAPLASNVTGQADDRR